MSHVFISYSRKNQQYARKLAEDIRKHGFDVWIDDHIDYGDRWWRTIVKAIEDSAAFVIIMSPDAEESEWVERELLLAQRSQKPIFPLLLEGREFALLITTQFANVSDGSLPKEDFYTRLGRVTKPAATKGAWVTPQKRSSRALKPWWKQRLAWLSAVMFVLVVLAALIIILILSDGDGITRTPSTLELTQTATYLANLVVSATIPEMLPTESPTSTPSPTEDPPTNTPTFTASNTSTLTPTYTPTPNLTATISAQWFPFGSGLNNNNPITTNEAWQPVIKPFEDVQMVLVPAGCFIMGSTTGFDDELPVHQQCIESPFWIDRYPITNSQFEQLGGRASTSSRFTEPDFPRQNVSWFEANDFCSRREARLPTEIEWEYAARGPDSLLYPWGQDFRPQNATYLENSSGTMSVYSHPDSASWVGAQEMIGNVWEWVDSPYVPYPMDPDLRCDGYVECSQRGGSWIHGLEAMRAPNRDKNAASGFSDTQGFRCARDFDDSSTLLSNAPVDTLPDPLIPPSLELAEEGVTNNENWEPYSQIFDGFDMVLVPTGCFMMGSDYGDDERPLHEQCLAEPFWIDRYEVTNDQYGSIGCGNSSYQPNHPRNCVDWFQAQAFCESRAGRLPTEAEWEYAARGPSSLFYPWGNDFISENVVWSENSGAITSIVGSRPSGMSWVGALDMSGNVWEWTSTIYDQSLFRYPYDANDSREAVFTSAPIKRVLRGGSWNSFAEHIRASTRSTWVNSDAVTGDVGFRCVRSY